MSFTPEELETQLELIRENDGLETSNVIPTDPWDEESYPLYLKKVGDETYVKVEYVDHEGGEGQGDQQAIILSTGYDSGKRYFKKSGYYDSWSGGEFDGEFQEVTLEKVTVEQWLPKKG